MCGSRFALLLATAFVVPLQADLKIKIRETYGPSASYRTEYYKPNFWRSEREPGDDLIVDSTNRRSFLIDTTRREYTVQTHGRAPLPANPARTFRVDIETRDTGEQRQAFGHTARHFMTTEHRYMEDGEKPVSEVQELVTDGWYLDIPGRFPGLSSIGTVTYLTSSPAGSPPPGPDFVVKSTGGGPQGLPIWEKTRDHVFEVIELSESPLDPKVFEPPAGFRRVIRPHPGEPLSWNDRLQLYWQQLLDWIGGAV